MLQVNAPVGQKLPALVFGGGVVGTAQARGQAFVLLGALQHRGHKARFAATGGWLGGLGHSSILLFQVFAKLGAVLCPGVELACGVLGAMVVKGLLGIPGKAQTQAAAHGGVCFAVFAVL